MAAEALYKDVLLDHFRHPRNKGDLAGADVVRRGSNPRCGDDIEVGLFLHGNQLDAVKFRGRGCSVCVAASSMMTEAVKGESCDAARRLCADMQACFGADGAEAPELPRGLEALAAVRAYPARRRCVLLAWQALSEALAAL